MVEKPDSRLIAGGRLGQALPFGILAAAGLILWTYWPQIPERFPTHFNARLEADAWSSKGLGTILFPLILGAATCALMALLARGIAGARRVHLEGEAAAVEVRRRRALGWLLLLVELEMALIFGLVALSPLARSPEESRTLVIVVLVLSFAGIFLLPLLLLTPTGRSLLAWNRSAEDVGTEERHWRWGLFYVNPDDPSWMVEKRVGIGYDLNWGHPKSKLLLLGLVAILLLALSPLLLF